MYEERAKTGRRQREASFLGVGMPRPVISRKGVVSSLAALCFVLSSVGIGRTLCCPGRPADMSCSEAVVAEATATAVSRAGHACCDARGEGRKLNRGAVATAPANVGTCCWSMGHIHGPAILPKSTGFIIQSLISNRQTVPITNLTRILSPAIGYAVPDRGSTNLRDCVFLI